ncbi:MAG: NifB/NifX family molybdenum-iron cluster-binding protein [Planctomycetes bacterium]|nr:NifB/NifX family molybdenum-iron cluster-binding protein [Planctomycetota bacterium]
MRVALAVWDGRISPVFDVSREVLILTVDGGAVVARGREDIETRTSALKIARLLALGVEVLICGAISEPLHQELLARGVTVLGFVAGDVEEVIAAFLGGGLPQPALSMPGCRGRQNRFRGGRRRAGRQGKGWGSRGLR